MGADGRTGPVASDWSENLRLLRPVVSVWSGGVGLVCGMKRGILSENRRLKRPVLHFGRAPV